MKSFSERIGISSPTKVQINDTSTELRNSLWNVILNKIGGEPNDGFTFRVGLEWLTDSIASKFFKIPLDELELNNWTERRNWIKKQFYSLKWNEVYDFIEFLAPKITHPKREVKRFQELLNNALERENSGYRMIDGQFVPITSEQEIKEIEEAIEKATKVGIEGAREHLSSALSLLAKKPEPDYRNSIKESISAVESVAKQISGEHGGGLDKALKKLSEKIEIHEALNRGFLRLYGYTSDEDGIRHAILESPNVGFDEAKFMLVSCSAFVNFLFSKAQRAGLLKEG